MKTNVKAAFPMVADAARNSSAGLGEIRLKGYLGERLDAMIAHNVAAKDVDYITAAFLEKTEEKGWWQTEFWGKWMHAAAPLLAYSGNAELREKIARGVERILSSQEKCGYIGNYPDKLRCGEGWDVWGMKYTMMGLMHYCDFVEGQKSKGERPAADSARALKACRRLCDYVIGEIGPNGRRGREVWQTGNWAGYASSSILEPVVWLYRRTGDEKYFDFATFIVKGMREPESGPRLIDLALKGVPVADRNGYGNEPETDGGYVMKHNRSKAYEMMSCYQGLLDYVEVRRTKDKGRRKETDDLLKAAVMTAEDIVREETNLAGGCACNEIWFHGAGKQHIAYARLQETCVTITWMRLCEKLLEVTDDAKWADEIERTFYNAYLAALKADGSEFTSYTPLSGNRWHGMHHCFMHEDCCDSNGPRGFLCFLRKFFVTDGDSATFNFYSSALVNGVVPKTGKKVSFEMYSLYPRMDWVRIVSHTEGAGVVPLRLRIPAWSEKTEVKLNGKALAGAKAGCYFTVAREWRLGDILEIKFDMPVVSHVANHFAAFTRGPVLLARDSRFNDGDLAEALRAGARFSFGGGLADGARHPEFNAVRVPSDEMWMAFSATLPIGAHHMNPEGALPVTVFFCDYASAGNRWARDNSYRTWFPIELGPKD